SYTAAMALPEDQTFCGQLQRLLNGEAAGNREWQVMNFGIFGSGTGQELALYRHVVRNLQPDIVIVAFGNATDLRDNSSELSSNPIVQFALTESGKLERMALSNDRIRLSNVLNDVSRFYSWQKQKTKSLKLLWQHKAAVNSGRSLVYAENEPPAYTRAWELTSALLDTFREECEADRCRLMVFAIPSSHQVYRDHFEELEKEICDADLDPLHPDRRLADACQEHDIPFLSLTENFQQHGWNSSYRDETRHLFFNGTGHLNERGSRLAAEQMSEWLSKTRLAEQQQLQRL
ncbi:MAG: SGNH/GDSL hydrolase family protein, partial [Planctomycetota bacterium]